MLRKVALAGATAQAAATLAQAAYALAHTSPTPPHPHHTTPSQPQQQPHTRQQQQQCAACSKHAQVHKLIAKAYSGRGVDAVALAEDATFEDPLVRCVGKAEVSEAFRALRACQPTHVRSPLAMPSADVDGGRGAVEVWLHQRYFGMLELESTVVVRSRADGLVSSIEERWHGGRLVGALALSRRLNGLASFYLTRLLIRS